MRGFGFGRARQARRRLGGVLSPMLGALSLAASGIVENSAAGTVVGGVLGGTTGSNLTLVDSAGGRFALSGGNLIAGATGTDFEAAASHAVTIRETLAGYLNSPRDTVLTVTVSNVFEQPSLAALSLSATSFTIGASATGSVTGAATGSTIAATGLPSGLTVNGAARTFAWSGSGSAATSTVTLTETLADSANSPRSSSVGITIAAAASQQVIIAVLAGQSNIQGRNTQDSLDAASITGVYQLIEDGGTGNQTLTSTIRPIRWSEGLDRVGPCGQFITDLAAANPTAKIIMVPVSTGSTAMVSGASPPWAPGATAGSGGGLFEAMITEANRAMTLAPGVISGTLAFDVRIHYAQGEQDAGNGVSRATYLAALTNFVSYARSRIANATSAPVMFTSMVPDLWDPGIAAGYSTSSAYVQVNAAHVDASLNISGVRYVVGPTDPGGLNDNLHYQPVNAARVLGSRMAAAYTDVVGPTVTTAATYSNTTSRKLAFALAGSDQHQTFHLNGGADAAQFEISDPYLTPVLRWAGDGTGPANGSYVVKVRARDGAGNYGADRTITVAVASTISPAAMFTGGEAGMVWDLTDLTTLFQDIAGTTPVTADGQLVGKVLDKSPNANHWVARANDSTRPTYKLVGGKSLLRFAGAQNLVAAAPFNTPTNLAITASIGLSAAAQGDKELLAANSSTSNGPFVLPFELKSSGGINGYGRSDSNSNLSASATLASVLDSTTRVITSFQAGGNQLNGLRDAASRPTGGGTKASGAYTSVTAGSTMDPPVTTTRSSLGSWAGTSFSDFITADVYSGFVINRTLTDAEIANAEDWVAARCLAGALP